MLSYVKSALDESMNLKELSEKLGISQTTVSRALGGYPEVSETTRQRIEAAAQRYGYFPNRRAAGLATGRSNMIGHILPKSTQHEMVNPIFGDFVAGAVETYSSRGFEMFLSQVSDQDEGATYRRLLQTAVVDGVIVQGPRANDPRIQTLTEMGLPFAVHGRSSGVNVPYNWVDVNNKSSFLRATEFLLDLGHRRIALINGFEDMDFAMRRRNGYIAGLQNRAIEIDPSIMKSQEMTEIYGYHQTRDMLTSDNPPTAILVSSLISAIGVRRAIEEAGLTMGKDVSVITHDDELSYLRNGETVPIFTATRSSVRDAGKHVANILIDQIENPNSLPQTQLLEAQLVVGRSTGPAPGSK